MTDLSIFVVVHVIIFLIIVNGHFFVAHLVYFYLVIKNDSSRKIPGPVNPKTKNGNLDDMTKSGSLHEYLKILHGKFGTITGFWYGEVYVVSISSPEHFKKISHLYNRPLGLYQSFEPLIAKSSIQYANDQEIKNRRALYDPAYSNKACVNYYEIIQTVTEEVADKWDKLPAEEHIDIAKEMVTAACLSIVRSSFDEEYFKEEVNASKLCQAYDVCWKIAEKSLSAGFPEEGTDDRRTFDKGKSEMLKIFEHLIKRKRGDVRTSSEKNFLETLIEAEVPDEQILSDSLTYIIGGFHTSGYLLTWILYYLAKNPKIQEQLYKELMEILDDQPITPECNLQLKFLKQVIDEGLRCSTLAPITARYSDEDITIDGYLIPKKTPMVTALGVCLENEEYYPNPDLFDPERFSSENTKKKPALAFAPFGFAGKRMCPGYKFAYVEVIIILSVICRRFKFNLIEGHPDVKKAYGLVTKPDKTIWMNITKRKLETTKLARPNS